MNRTYNHVKHFVYRSDKFQSIAPNFESTIITKWLMPCCRQQAGNHDANNLDGKQRHTGFNYYEYDVSKPGI